ncbi:MAG: helix-turn-helix transcriptional regulator [Burkholderiaceae bacterium]|nr:helix-turn-helix transcriptional regulator [Burkholderiaceae bacterium]
MSPDPSGHDLGDELTVIGGYQLARGDLMAAACPSRAVLQHVTSRWGVLVLATLLVEGTQRFSALRRRIGGVSEKMLSQTLKELEGDGFVQRVVHASVPPQVDYRLTPLGRQVAGLVRELADWIEASLPAILQARQQGEARQMAKTA